MNNHKLIKCFDGEAYRRMRYVVDKLEPWTPRTAQEIFNLITSAMRIKDLTDCGSIKVFISDEIVFLFEIDDNKADITASYGVDNRETYMNEHCVAFNIHKPEVS